MLIGGLTTIETAFWNTLLRQPDDWTGYLVFADWLQDRGEGDDPGLEYALRWMAAWRRRPFHREYYWRNTPQQRRVQEEFQWGWYPNYHSQAAKKVKAMPYAVLPRVVFLSIGAARDHHLYSSMVIAIRALASGLAHIRQVTSLEGPK